MRFRMLLFVFSLSAIGAHADAGDCTSTCSIKTATTGYTAPANVIKSGSSVRWVSADSDSHPTSDKPFDQSPCFSVSVGPNTQPVAVTFTIVSKKVTAKTGTAAAKTCATATALANGDQVLPFQCNVHGWMRGQLLIHP